MSRIGKKPISQRVVLLREKGKSLVISLSGTSEARKDQVTEANANGGMLEDWDFSPAK
jgi:hypothetical protein